MMDKVPKKMNVSVNFPGALYSLLDFLILEAGTNRLPWNVSVVLPLYAMRYLRGAQTSHDLVIQALVWLHMIWFSAIWFSVVQFDASYANLKQPRLSKCKI